MAQWLTRSHSPKRRMFSCTSLPLRLAPKLNIRSGKRFCRARLTAW